MKYGIEHMTENMWYPVCERCLVKCIRCYIDSENRGRTVWYKCPICENGDPLSSIIESGLTEEELEGNLLFLLFMNCEVTSKWD